MTPTTNDEGGPVHHLSRSQAIDGGALVRRRPGAPADDGGAAGGAVGLHVDPRREALAVVAVAAVQFVHHVGRGQGRQADGAGLPAGLGRPPLRGGGALLGVAELDGLEVDLDGHDARGAVVERGRLRNGRRGRRLEPRHSRGDSLAPPGLLDVAEPRHGAGPGHDEPDEDPHHRAVVGVDEGEAPDDSREVDAVRHAVHDDVPPRCSRSSSPGTRWATRPPRNWTWLVR